MLKILEEEKRVQEEFDRLKEIKKDFTEYLPLVRQGGYVLLDDYAEHMKDVIQFVEDVDESVVERIGELRYTGNKRVGTYVLRKL